MAEMLTASEDEQTVEDPEKIDELERQQRPPLLYLLTSGLSNLFEKSQDLQQSPLFYTIVIPWCHKSERVPLHARS